MNVDRLKEYKARLVVFPRHAKKGTAVPDVPQLVGDILPRAVKQDAVSFVTLTEEMKNEKAYGKLRAARNDARLVGIRLKQKTSEKDEKKPAAAGDD